MKVQVTTISITYNVFYYGFVFIVNYDFRLISGRVWIGMYGDNNKQSLSWINGISVEYVEWSTSDPIDWNQSYPNGTLPNTKCVGLDISDNYTFVDPLCTEVLPYLCTGKSVHTLGCISWNAY